MAEAPTLVPTHPLERWRAAFAALTDELAAAPGTDLAIELAPLGAALDLRVAPSGLGAMADLLGGPLPTAPNTWAPIRDGQAVWLGPDEWLLTSPTASGPAWEAEVRAVAAEHHGAAVDVSAQRTGLRLRGRGARELLRFGCALDLRPASFPAGSCAQTLLGQSGVLLVADPGPDDDALFVVVRRSFAGYVADLLLDAAGELRRHTQRTDQEGDES